MSLGRFGGSAPILRNLKSGEGGITGIATVEDMLQQARDQLREAPEGAYTVGRVVVGTFDRDTSLADGTQAITGVGFRPYVVFLFGSIDTTREITWGFENGTTRQSVAAIGGSGGTNFAPQAGRSMRFDQGGGALYDGTSGSMDIDGFTITWTKTGAKTGTATIKYMAFGRG